MNRQEKPLPSPLRSELSGIIVMTLGVLVLLSIWSYAPTDPLIFDTDGTESASLPSSTTNNLIGVVGATIAYGLLWLVGGAAYGVSVLIIFQGFKTFTQENWLSTVRCTSGSIFAVVCLSALLALFSPADAGFSIENELQDMPGGITGQVSASVLTQYFAETGSVILLSMGLLVSLLLIRPFSLAATAQRTPVWSVGKVITYPFALLRALRWERGKRVKANKPVKINRGLGIRGGAWSWKKNRDESEGRKIIAREPLEDSEPLVPEELDPRPVFGRIPKKISREYRPPDPKELLASAVVSRDHQSDQVLETQSRVLTGALQSFGIGGKVTEIHPGPVITMFEFEPAPGIKVARIVSLAHDLAMALKATNVRIVAPLPGKSTVGIEVPNPSRETVGLREILTSDVFRRSRSKLTLALGKDIFGRPVVADLRSMPHLLVAGATGAGKSVGLNSMLLSMLFSVHPNEVKFLLIDPKVLELQVYDGIPHLIRPVITNPKAAARGLNWVVQEMERRYRLLAEYGVRNIQAFNLKVTEDQEGANSGESVEAPRQQKLPLTKDIKGQDLELGESADGEQVVAPEPLPYIVVVVDEFADLMMIAPKEVEEKIARLAQMARASGIHLILATQRPSVDVVTGLIKANFPARIAYQVSSKIDSRTILDANGAESLLGLGDMLYMASGTGRINRLHGSYISDEEVRGVVEWVKAQAEPSYLEESGFSEDAIGEQEGERDEVYEQAREVVISSGQASASLIQRRLRVGYPRAARMIEQMEEEGLVSAPGRDGRREVLGRRIPMQEEVG